MKFTKKLLFTSIICGVMSFTVLLNSKANGKKDNIETVALSDENSLREVLATNSHFPNSYTTGWQGNDNSAYRTYVEDDYLVFVRDTTQITKASLDDVATKSGNNYIRTIYDFYAVNLTFYFNGEELSSIDLSCSGAPAINQTFSHVHNPIFVEKVDQTCESAGCKSYYECDCGNQFWEDTGDGVGDEIFDFEEWKTNGDGFIPADGHMYSGNPIGTWDGSALTLSLHCMHCDHVDTETVEGTYVKESDATQTEKEKGHHVYELYEDDLLLEKYVSESFEVGEVLPPVEEENNNQENVTEEGLSGGAIAGISIGAVAGVSLLTYIGLFIGFVKTKKAPKFLVKSFEWILKLFTK